jgi:hypothetical protein
MADLLVLLDDAIAVSSGRSVPAGVGAVEDMRELFLVHALAGILHANLT